jgi:hypothetical protein|tara:strand:- start:2256 stop:2519 length:264 start_codon:yes stop_codon:yes gene_type:complete
MTTFRTLAYFLFLALISPASAMLHPHPVVQGQPKDLHTVSFSAQKEVLKNCTFMIVAYGSLRGGVGYILKVSDFLNFNIATIQTDKR